MTKKKTSKFLFSLFWIKEKSYKKKKKNFFLMAKISKENKYREGMKKKNISSYSSLENKLTSFRIYKYKYYIVEKKI